MYLRSRIKLPENRGTLSTQLTCWYASAFIAFLFTTLASMYLAIGSILDHRLEEDLIEDVEEFREYLVSGGLESIYEEIQREVKHNDQSTFFIRLFDGKGRLIAASDLNPWTGLPPISALDTFTVDKKPALKGLSLPDHEHDIKTATGALTPDLLLQVGESEQENDEIMDILLLVSSVIFFVIIPLASYIGWIMAQRAVSGIREVSRAAQDIKNGLLDRRALVQRSGDEITELAETFNAMAERIRTLISEMHEMTDNIAHDLRSPLARIRAISEVALTGQSSTEAYQKAAADTLEECDRLLHMINMTLDVAEAEAGVGNAQKEELNLSELALEACELFGPLAEEKSIKFNVAIDPGFILPGNKHNLQRMLANLIDNALKYTPENGAVTIQLQGGPSGIKFSVADTGIGIPVAEQARVFERFYRCDQSRNQEGCGLGLSFSRAVARAHGGDIYVQSAPEYQSVFTVILPFSWKMSTSTPIS